MLTNTSNGAAGARRSLVVLTHSNRVWPRKRQAARVAGEAIEKDGDRAWLAENLSEL